VVRLLLVSILALLTAVSCSSAATSISAPSAEASGVIHSIPTGDLGNASRYWNTDWKGCAPQLYAEIADVNSLYHQTHTYVPGETDCNDMAADIWGSLAGREIVSLIVVGNLETARESFAECNHAWLIVYSGEGSAAALEVTAGRTYTWEDALDNASLRQYWEGFVYESPSDLAEDFDERW
jgi:hypothetical protein